MSVLPTLESKMNLGPDEKVTGYIDFFLRELDDDFQAPGQSHFQDCMAKLRRDVLNMEEVRPGQNCSGGEGCHLPEHLQSLSGDKSFVRRLITSLKEAVRAGECKIKLCAFEFLHVRLPPFFPSPQLTGARSPRLQTTW